MNVLFFELRKQGRSLVLWTVSLVVLLYGLLMGMYPIYSGSKEELLQMIASFPPQFMSVFGMNVEEIFSVPGFLDFGYTYLGVVGVIMAVNFALSIFYREKRTKSMDFLFSKPIERGEIYRSKYLAGLLSLLIVNLFYVAMFLYVIRAQDSALGINGNTVVAALGLLCLELLFYAIGVLLAVLSKKIRSIAGTATLVGMVVFILAAVANLLEKEEVYYISPLRYFSPKAAFDNGIYHWKYSLIALAVMLLCTFVSYLLYVRRDTAAA